MLSSEADGARVVLHSPTAMPRASAYLWNRCMVLQVNCRGYVVARHMQPEPSAYSHPPFLEARTFVQPEQPVYAHHPGRFVWLRDDDNGARWSLPYEPARQAADDFRFEAESDVIRWRIALPGLEASLSVRLPADQVAELWTLVLRNTGAAPRRLSVYPCFSIGYMSWMNQSAAFETDSGALVARSVTPYQKLEEFDRVRDLKDLTFLLPDRAPDAWEAALENFEGEGGWHDPAALDRETLDNGEAIYETPLAALQYRVTLPPGGEERWRFVFGPAGDSEEIQRLARHWRSSDAIAQATRDTTTYLAGGAGCLSIDTPDPGLDAFVNHWLSRQVFYHGDTHRLTTDPQTRNYLQDAMGMVYLDPERAREQLAFALAQQRADGGMPEGVLLTREAELKYINEVPHMDHCVWLPLCLAPYLDETGDDAFLDHPVTALGTGESQSVFERVTAALRWLLRHRDDRGLSLLNQGDWCDPLNMAGAAGRGVSTWLSQACVHALRSWAPVARRRGDEGLALDLEHEADTMADAIRTHCWDGDWFARGITDAGRPFGVAADEEGRIWLNPQGWALLSGVATADQRERLLAAMDRHLSSPWGMQMLAPPYTGLVPDVGRVTQKFPGSAENGSIYNHACAFLVHALYRIGEPERAWTQLRRMLPAIDAADTEDLLRRGQLPVFVPNYYRGAARRHPRTAGRSSQLFHTGTASWLYRILVEDLFGLKGTPQGLHIQPALPAAWDGATVRRHFRGAIFDVHYKRNKDACTTELILDEQPLEKPLITPIRTGRRYRLDILLPGPTP